MVVSLAIVDAIYNAAIWWTTVAKLGGGGGFIRTHPLWLIIVNLLQTTNSQSH